LHKKGDKHKINNYRPIGLTPTTQKIFAKIIANRLKNILDCQQPQEQAGFQTGYSTIDHLHSVSQLIEKSQEYQRELYVAFIDYNKTFDSIGHEYMFEALKNQGVPKSYRELIETIYTGLKARVITERKGEFFEINKGVKQGDPMSSLMFNCILEEIFSNLSWEDKGINIKGEKLNNLRFADNVVLVTGSMEELKTMIEELDKQSRRAGLTINI